MDGLQCKVRFLKINVIALSREISQYVIEKLVRKNPGLEIPIWLEKEDKKGKTT